MSSIPQRLDFLVHSWKNVTKHNLKKLSWDDCKYERRWLDFWFFQKFVLEFGNTVMKNPVEGVIEDVILEDDKIQPIIVNFQNGKLKDKEARRLDCGLFYDKQSKKRCLAMSNGQVVYKGYRPNPDKELTYTLLAIRNAVTGKVRLIQAERWQVTPVLDQMPLESLTESTEDKLATLNKQFGSKRAKRQAEQYERMKVNVDSVKDVLEKSVANIEIDAADLANESINDSFISDTNLPPCNRDASSASEVYDINDIVPKNKLATLHDRAKEILKNGDVEGSSKFFVESVKALENRPENLQKVAIFIYIEAVAAWLKMPIKDAKKRALEICPLSSAINAYIIDNYSVSSSHGRQRPNTMRDKGIIHSIILALIACNFQLDLELFATALHNRVGLKKLTDLARIIGAVTLKDSKKVVVLKVPLPPQLSVIKKSRKK